MSVEDLIRHCGLEFEEAWLEREITGEHFHELSGYLCDWDMVAPLLGLSSTDVDDIERDNPKAEKRRESFLKRWQQKSVKATYRALVDALLKIERVHDAKGVCQLLKGNHDSMSLRARGRGGSRILPAMPSFDYTHHDYLHSYLHSYLANLVPRPLLS